MEEFKYLGGGANMRDSRAGKPLPQGGTDGFLTSYSRAAIDEDMAELFSFLITNPRHVLECSQSDPILASKVELLRRLLRTDIGFPEWFCRD